MQPSCTEFTARGEIKYSYIRISSTTENGYINVGTNFLNQSYLTVAKKNESIDNREDLFQSSELQIPPLNATSVQIVMIVRTFTVDSRLRLHDGTLSIVARFQCFQRSFLIGVRSLVERLVFERAETHVWPVERRHSDRHCVFQTTSSLSFFFRSMLHDRCTAAISNANDHCFCVCT